MRKITVYSTVGQNMQIIESDCTKWGILKSILSEKQIPVNELKSVVGETHVTLESSEAALPDGDFTLFLMPKKPKSGALDRKTLFAEIKQFVIENPTKKGLFIIDGKNMTQLSTPILQELYLKHIASNKPSPEPVSTQPAAPVVEIVEEKMKVRNEGVFTISDLLEQALQFARQLEDQMFAAHLEAFINDTKVLLEDPLEAERIRLKAEEAIAKERILREKLANQAEALKKQFSDLK